MELRMAKDGLNTYRGYDFYIYGPTHCAEISLNGEVVGQLQGATEESSMDWIDKRRRAELQAGR